MSNEPKAGLKRYTPVAVFVGSHLLSTAITKTAILLSTGRKTLDLERLPDTVFVTDDLEQVFPLPALSFPIHTGARKAPP